jgi:hypothetical protein
MNNGKLVPKPEQVQTWLRAHGWIPENPLPANLEDGVRFTYKELSDDGEEIWIVAPGSMESPPWYPLLVQAVIVTAAGMEDRPEADVLAEMLATEITPVPAPRTPPVPTT